MNGSRIFTLTAFALAAAALSACATKPGTTPAPSTPPPATTSPVTPPANSGAGPVATQPMGPVPGSQQDFVVNVGDRVYFDTDQSSIRADARATLEAQAAWLARYPQVRIRIEGNCDERGTREYNFALGARRAQAVAEYLTSRGIAPSRIATISYGKEQPADDGSGDAAWAHNRNAHTAITSGAN